MKLPKATADYFYDAAVKNTSLCQCPVFKASLLTFVWATKYVPAYFVKIR